MCHTDCFSCWCMDQTFPVSGFIQLPPFRSYKTMNTHPNCSAHTKTSRSLQGAFSTLHSIFHHRHGHFKHREEDIILADLAREAQGTAGTISTASTKDCSRHPRLRLLPECSSSAGTGASRHRNQPGFQRDLLPGVLLEPAGVECAPLGFTAPSEHDPANSHKM